MGSVMRLRCRYGAAQAIEAIREHSVHEILTAYKIVHACAEGLQGIVDTSRKIIELRQIDWATLELARALAHLKPGECETDICGDGNPEPEEEDGEVGIHHGFRSLSRGIRAIRSQG